MKEKSKQMLYSIYSNIVKTTSININRLILNDKQYIYYYILFVLTNILYIISDTIVNSQDKIKYDEIILKCDNLMNNDDLLNECCDKVMHSIKNHIIFFDIIPENIKVVIKNITDNDYLPQKNMENMTDGPIIEKNIFLSFIQKYKLDSTIRTNELLYDDNKKIINKPKIKSELDIIVGAYDKDKNVYKISNVYDIKRSARLIPEDIEKFNNALTQNFSFKDGTKTTKFNDYIKGYLYKYDWDKELQTKIKIYNILLELCSNYSTNVEQFIRMCKLITNTCIIIDDQLNSIITKILEEENKLLQSKLSEFDIKKCY